MKRVFGVLTVFIGVSILVWIGYNLFIEMQPEAEGRNPIGPLIFSCIIIFTGIKRTFGKI